MNWDLSWELFTPAGKQAMHARCLEFMLGPRVTDWSGGLPETRRILEAWFEQREAFSPVRRKLEARIYADLWLQATCEADRRRPQREATTRLRTLCLTSHPDSLLMWAHYTEGHKGALLEFDVDHLESSFAIVVEKVQYQESLPKLIDLDTWVEALCVGRNPGCSIRDLDVFALTKHDQWRYEDEWRFVRVISPDRGRTPQLQSFAPRALRSVHLGVNMSADDERRIRDQLEKYPRQGEGYDGPALYRTVHHPSEFRLQKVPLDLAESGVAHGS